MVEAVKRLRLTCIDEEKAACAASFFIVWSLVYACLESVYVLWRG